MPIRKSAWLYIVLILVALAALWVWASFNSLIRSQESVKNAWAQVETTYQRRIDLVPNLVNTVKGSADFEQSTLTAVTQARTQWLAAPTRQDKLAAAQGMESALARLLVSVEAYPQIQSTQAFKDLMTQLEGTENRINQARRDYNDAVKEFNIAVRVFPRNVIAGLFGFDQEKPFEAAAGSETAPVVDFGTKQ